MSVCGGCEGYIVTVEGQRFRAEDVYCRAIFCSKSPDNKPKPSIICVLGKCPSVYLDMRLHKGGKP